ncbi:MAG: GlmU family protein [Ignavibacterium sp.]
MIESICIFEYNTYNNFYPLTYYRPTYDLRCGILTLKEKIRHYFPSIQTTLQCRNYLADFIQEKNIDCLINKIEKHNCLFINGSVLFNQNLLNQIDINQESIYIKDNTIVAAFIKNEKLKDIKFDSLNIFDNSLFKNFPTKNVDATICMYPWDLIYNNGDEIISDFNLLIKNIERNIKGKLYEGVHLINDRNIFIDEETKIKSGVVLDAEEGPIYIGKNVEIFPNAVIQGPAFIGDNSKVKMGAKIYKNTSIGEVCKVGGEVDNSIIHSFANKQHEGYLGHSYLGMWINIGADTNNSDLKNNYGNIKIKINGIEIDTGKMFIGLIMGDHSKTGINTMFNTGTVVGFSSNIFGSNYPPKFIPSFIWGGVESFDIYDLEKSLEVAKKVMARRNVIMSQIEEKVFRTIFDITKEERKKYN